MIKENLQPLTKELYLSREGLAFSSSDLHWKLSRDVRISLAWIEEHLSEKLRTAYIQNLVFHAEVFSAHYTSNINSHFRNLILFLTESSRQIDRLEVSDFINYRSALTPKNEWYLAGLIAFFKRWVEVGLDGVDESVINLFSSWRLKGNRKGEAVLTFCPHKGALSDLELENLHQKLTDAFEDDLIRLDLNIISERTKKALDVSPVRLRRTLATRAAREGYGVLTIAELLDHSDTQSAVVYTENVPEHIDAINRAVAEQLAPIAQAFAGVLINNEKEAKRGDDLSSRVRSSTSGDGVGSCGHYGFCNALAPIACYYTCRNFQPWLDAPHEEVLEGLLAQREEIKARTNDLVMASVNDRAIFAVTEVIQLCKQRKVKQIER